MIRSHLILLIFLFSCQEGGQQNKGKVLAKVGDKELYSYQLQSNSENRGPEDSLQKLQTEVANWVREQIILQKAENTLKEGQMDFEEEVREYYNSLLIYAFERELLKGISDSLITEMEIEAFYDEHKDQFKQNKPIIKYKFIKAAASTERKSELKRKISSDKSSELDDLSSFCLQYAYSYNLDDSSWYYADDVMGEVPISMSTNISLSQTRRTYAASDSDYYYLLRIEDYLGPGKVSPLSFVSEKIKNILQLRRKTSYLNRYYQELYDEAERKEQIQIYVKN